MRASRGLRRGVRVVVVWAALASGCGPAPDAGGLDPEAERAVRAAQVPDSLRAAEAVFAAGCAGCHGQRALGTDQGPPLVHRVYQPSHHADFAFALAVRQGVRAHHWRFGDMPAVPGLAPDQVRAVTGYVRWLQRQAGIY